MTRTLFLLACVSLTSLVTGTFGDTAPCEGVANSVGSAHPSFQQDVGLCSVVYRIHEDGLELTVSAATTGWLGFAFPADASGQMHDAWAIIGTEVVTLTLINEYHLNNKPPVHLPGAVANGVGGAGNLMYTDAGLETSNGMTTLTAFVPFNTRIISGTTVPVICAYSFNDSPSIVYHGGNRFQGALNLACPADE
eukprot:jgi/Ulvmu1/7542/UM037_0086.1